MATAYFDEGGLIRRYTAWAGCPPAAPRGGVDTGADVAEVIDRYFHHLEVGEFEAAVACFSENVRETPTALEHTGITNRTVWCSMGTSSCSWRSRSVAFSPSGTAS